MHDVEELIRLGKYIQHYIKEILIECNIGVMKQVLINILLDLFTHESSAFFLINNVSRSMILYFNNWTFIGLFHYVTEPDHKLICLSLRCKSLFHVFEVVFALSIVTICCKAFTNTWGQFLLYCVLLEDTFFVGAILKLLFDIFYVLVLLIIIDSFLVVHHVSVPLAGLTLVALTSTFIRLHRFLGLLCLVSGVTDMISKLLFFYSVCWLLVIFDWHLDSNFLLGVTWEISCFLDFSSYFGCLLLFLFLLLVLEFNFVCKFDVKIRILIFAVLIEQLLILNDVYPWDLHIEAIKSNVQVLDVLN